jgi:hypothetical protein
VTSTTSTHTPDHAPQADAAGTTQAVSGLSVVEERIMGALGLRSAGA